MEQQGYNIYDEVEDFYAQDPGWELVCSRRLTEGFLREQAWQGKDDDELYRLWGDLCVFFLYIGNSDLLLGDVSAADFIDNVGWNGRNVAGFAVTEKAIARYLDSAAAFYAYLRRQHQVLSDAEPAKAKAWFATEAGKKAYDVFGEPRDKKARFAATVPDLPSKAFMDLEGSVGSCLSMIGGTFLQGDAYEEERERAEHLYYDYLPPFLSAYREDPGEKNGFNDYFIFDHRFAETGLTPLEMIADEVEEEAEKCAAGVTPEGFGSQEDFVLFKDSVEELLKAKRTCFTAEKIFGEGDVLCKDVFDGTTFTVRLDLPKPEDYKNRVFIAHLFLDRSAVLNSLQGIAVTAERRKAWAETVKRAYRIWALGQEQEESGMADFLAANPVFPRASLLYHAEAAAYRALQNWELPKDYEPAPFCDDDTDEYIEHFSLYEGLSVDDADIARRLWADFKALFPADIGSARLWAAAAVKALLLSWALPSPPYPSALLRSAGIKKKELDAAINTIFDTLDLKIPDARYAGQEVLLKELTYK